MSKDFSGEHVLASSLKTGKVACVVVMREEEDDDEVVVEGSCTGT